MDLAAERDRLLELDARWASLAQAGTQLDEILSFWSDDAIVVPPGFPLVTGRTQIRDYVEASLRVPGFSINWTSTEVGMSADGSMAFLFGANRVTMGGPEDGEITAADGRVVTIWQRDLPDGEWRCVVDIWNAAS